MKSTTKWTLLAGALVALALAAGCTNEPEGNSTPVGPGGGNGAGMNSGGGNGAGGNTAEGGAAAADGATVYATSCQGCHGENGAGVEGSGPELTHTATTGEDKLREIIENGSDDKKMPAFKDQLSEEEITAVIAHVRTFGGEGGAPAAEPGHEGHNHPPGQGH